MQTESVQITGPFCKTCLHTRHLIVCLEKEQNWLLIQRKSQIACKFREITKLAVNLEIKQIFKKNLDFS